MKQFIYDSFLRVIVFLVLIFLSTRGCDWIESFGEDERATQLTLAGIEATRAAIEAEQKELYGSDEERRSGLWTAMSLYSAFENNPGRLVTTLGNNSFFLKGIVHEISTTYISDSVSELRTVELVGKHGDIWTETVSVVGIPNGVMPSKGSTFFGVVRFLPEELDKPVCLYLRAN